MNSRELILKHLEEKAKLGHHCQSCPGTCCTDVANSMMISSSEARTIQNYLIGQGKWDEDLLLEIRECVRHYRLDIPVPGDGRRSYIRRTYTCPFYQLKLGGCQIPRTHRPLGCLAFNPTDKNRIGEGGCEQTWKLSSQSDSFPIPVAILNLVSEK